MAVDLTTDYLGLELANPLVVGACPLTRDSVMLKRLEDAGAAAVVLPSLFSEQIDQCERELFPSSEGPDGVVPDVADPGPAGCSADMAAHNLGPDGYLRHVEIAKQTVDVPVIASLNSGNHGDWERFARLIEQAGADALELNICFIPTKVTTSGQDVERRHVEIVTAVRKAISIPLAVKIGPYFASIPGIAKQLVDAGADGLVLFNRYLEPRFDIERFAVEPHLELSTPSELRLPLRWIGILSDQLSASLAATSGIHSGSDALQAVLAGANVAMIASSLLINGPAHLSTLLEEINAWLVRWGRENIREVRGMMNAKSQWNSRAFERANYLEALASFEFRAEPD